MAAKVKEVLQEINPFHDDVRLLTVFGATGSQGGSVIRHVLAHPQLSKQYKLRAVTRDTSKPAAVALQEKGVEVVKADLNNVESVNAAIHGSQFVFGVTDFWSEMSAEVEVRQGKTIVDAAKAAHVKLLIWSSLPHVSRESKGKLTGVHHFDSKAEVEDYAREVGIPAVYFMPGIFMNGAAQQIRKNEQGEYTWNIPFSEDTKIPYFAAAEDTGLFVAAILLSDRALQGQRFLAAAGYTTPHEMALEFEQATGKKVTLNRITYEQFHSFLPAAIADELTDNFRLLESPGYYVGEPADKLDRDIHLVSQLGLGAPTNFRQYIEKNPPQ